MYRILYFFFFFFFLIIALLIPLCFSSNCLRNKCTKVNNEKAEAVTKGKANNLKFLMATSFASRLFGCHACALCNVLQAVDSFQLCAHVGFQWITVHKHGVMSSCDFHRCVSWGLCIFNLFACILMIWKDRKCEYFCEKNRWKFWIWECRWIYVHLGIKKSFFFYCLYIQGQYYCWFDMIRYYPSKLNFP